MTVTFNRLCHPEAGKWHTRGWHRLSGVLTNVYLPYALDLWSREYFDEVVKARRFCIVMLTILYAASDEQKKHSGFTTELEERLPKFGLDLARQPRVIPASPLRP